VTVTALKKAFELARAEGNIDVVVDPLLAADLYVVGKEFPDSAKPQFYAVPSPAPNRICVTASESSEALAGLPDVVLMQMTGRELLDSLEPFLELMIVYDNGGGEYLSREHLDWFRELRNVTGTP
jgi:hypothetical protein